MSNDALRPADAGRLDQPVGRLVPYSDAWLLARAAESGEVLRQVEKALPGAMTVAAAKLPALPVRGCSECAWGKVAGCWRCGSR